MAGGSAKRCNIQIQLTIWLIYLTFYMCICVCGCSGTSLPNRYLNAYIHTYMYVRNRCFSRRLRFWAPKCWKRFKYAPKRNDVSFVFFLRIFWIKKPKVNSESFSSLLWTNQLSVLQSWHLSLRHHTIQWPPSSFHFELKVSWSICWHFTRRESRTVLRKEELIRPLTKS